MKVSSVLPICCACAASFSVVIATQARADQEVTPSMNKFEDPYPNSRAGGVAFCTEANVPWNCSSADDFVEYNIFADWYGSLLSGSQGWARADVAIGHVSPGDYAWLGISLRCDDGSWGSQWNSVGANPGPDGGPPPQQVISSCPDGVYAYEADFAYGVEVEGGS